MNRLTKALKVESVVLTGALPLPQVGSPSVPRPPDVYIGADIAPKARFAYDLVKRRYGVSAAEIITMAPLFFTLLVKGSLSLQRKTLAEGRLHVEFPDGGNSWELPDRSDKKAIRHIREDAVNFVLDQGASYPGQTNAVRKALTDTGYHLTK